VTINLNTKIITVLAFTVLSTLASAKATYDEADLEQFNKTNSCIKCDLSNASVNAKENALLNESILIGATLKGNFTNSSFLNAILTQANFNYHKPQVMTSQFQGSTMQYANVSGVSFSGSNFEGANLRNVNFTDANLSSANFTNADITNAKLDNSILIGSNLTKEQLSTVSSFYCAVLPDGTLAAPEHEYSTCR